MNLAIPGIAGLSTTELLLIVFVLVLLFGAKKLPEVARGTGRALRIFKSETKGLVSDDDEAPPPPASGSTQLPSSPPPTQVEPITPAHPVEETVRPDQDR